MAKESHSEYGERCRTAVSCVCHAPNRVGLTKFGCGKYSATIAGQEQSGYCREAHTF